MFSYSQRSKLRRPAEQSQFQTNCSPIWHAYRTDCTVYFVLLICAVILLGRQTMISPSRWIFPWWTQILSGHVASETHASPSLMIRWFVPPDTLSIVKFLIFCEIEGFDYFPSTETSTISAGLLCINFAPRKRRTAAASITAIRIISCFLKVSVLYLCFLS